VLDAIIDDIRAQHIRDNAGRCHRRLIIVVILLSNGMIVGDLGLTVQRFV
jgi:hypothetical protein